MGYNMNIPQVRKRLFEIAEETNNEELAYLANELHQKQMKKKAPIKSDEFTPELVPRCTIKKLRIPSTSILVA